MLVSYPNLRYLSACVLTPGRYPPADSATSPNISPLRSTSSASASNRAAGQNSPRSACLQPKRDKTLPACAKLPKMRVFWRAGRILSREHPQTDHAGRILSREHPQTGHAGRILSREHPQTDHAGRILSRKTLRSGNAGRLPCRLQLRGRTLTPGCARSVMNCDELL